MKFKTSKNNLVKVLNLLTPITPQRAVKPVLECINLYLSGNMLKATASDQYTTVETMLEVEGDVDGEISVNAKKLQMIIKSLPDKPVICEQKENTLKIKAGKPKFEIAIMGDPYPQCPDAIKETINIDSAKLVDCIDKTTFATSDDDLRPPLTGVLFDIKGSKLTLVSSDMAILSKITTDINYTGDDISVIIPKKPLNTLAMVAFGLDDVSVGIDENYVQMSCGNTTIYTRVIGGQFPAYKSIIPQSMENEAIFNVKDTIGALQRVSISCNPLTKAIKADFTENDLLISASDVSSNSRASENIEGNYSGGDTQIGLISTSLLNMLKKIDTDKVSIGFNSPVKPVIIKNNNDDDFLMLIMPVKLG